MLAPDAGSNGHECAESSSTLHHHFANLQFRQTLYIYTGIHLKYKI
jgi:hypothetical protein